MPSRFRKKGSAVHLSRLILMMFVGPYRVFGLKSNLFSYLIWSFYVIFHENFLNKQEMNQDTQ